MKKLSMKNNHAPVLLQGVLDKGLHSVATWTQRGINFFCNDSKMSSSYRMKSEWSASRLIMTSNTHVREPQVAKNGRKRPQLRLFSVKIAVFSWFINNHHLQQSSCIESSHALLPVPRWRRRQSPHERGKWEEGPDLSHGGRQDEGEQWRGMYWQPEAIVCLLVPIDICSHWWLPVLTFALSSTFILPHLGRHPSQWQHSEGFFAEAHSCSHYGIVCGLTKKYFINTCKARVTRPFFAVRNCFISNIQMKSVCTEVSRAPGNCDCIESLWRKAQRCKTCWRTLSRSP